MHINLNEVLYGDTCWGINQKKLENVIILYLILMVKKDFKITILVKFSNIIKKSVM